MKQTTNAQKQNNKQTQQKHYGRKINIKYKGKGTKPRKNNFV
jgi:hypothetical protein